MASDQIPTAELAVQAFDIMRKRGWYVVPCRYAKVNLEWSVRVQNGYDMPLKFIVHHPSRGARPDPVTILIEADEWYRQNID